MSTTTTNYGLIKPGTDDPILVGQLNDNMDTIDTVLKDHSDKIDAASLGIKYKGEVNYYSNLPTTGVAIGDAYTVKYAGSSGTTPDGTEYVWGTVSGTNQWINFSKDSYTKAEVDALLALKVDTAGTGLSKSGTTLNHSNSTTAKTTQGFAQIAYDAQGHITGSTAATTVQANAINSGIDSTKVEQIETNKNNISYIENTGKKNWLKPDTISGVPTGITVQYESDDSITINGTYSGSGYAYVFLHSFAHEAMQYTLSCNVATATNTFYFYTRDDKMSTTITPTYTYTENGTTRIVVRIAPNTSFDNVNVKLMIRPSIITDATYQPYAMSNAELTQSLLPTSYSSPTLIDDTTCTINEGGYVTVGNIVVVNVTFTTTASYAAYGSIMQFPVPKNSGSITMVAAAHIDSSVNVAVNKYGQIALFDTPLPAGTYHFFTVYLKQ